MANKDNNQNQDLRPLFSEWLEKLQEESWQLELLISGLALVGIWTSRDLIVGLENYLSVNGFGTIYKFLKILIPVIWFGWAVFLINLIFHIIIRGLWIGAIGLRYVSGDIDFEELGYSDTFKDFYKRKIKSFDHYIESLERLSSVLFSYTFLLFFMFFSLIMISVCFASVVSFSHAFMPDHVEIISGVVIGTLMVVGLIVLVDFLFLGPLKKTNDKTIAKIYLYIYRFFSTITLSFLYRPLLLNFLDNRYTRRLFFLSIPYAIILIFVVNNAGFEKYGYIPNLKSESAKQNVNLVGTIDWHYYDDVREKYYTYGERESRRKEKINGISLSKYKVNNELSFFLEYYASDNEYLESVMGDISAFSSTGFKNNIINKDFSDDKIVAINIAELKELNLMRKVLQGKEIKEEERLVKKERVEYFAGFDLKDMDLLEIEIDKKYAVQRIDYRKEKAYQIKNKLLDLIDIRIDGIDMKDSIDCKFYTHPNLGERGLLCSCLVDRLNRGDHELFLHRKSIRIEKDELVDTYSKYILLPFVKN